VNRVRLAIAVAFVAASCGSGSSSSHASTTAPTTVPANAFVTVFVAKRDIPKCSSLDEQLASGAITSAATAGRDVPAGAVTDLHQLAGRFATQPLVAGKIVLAAQVALPPFPGC
jgi:flagella basal body P-ring formation protein FlgA